MDTSALDALLADLLRGEGISCSADQRRLLLAHLELVLEWNRQLNLTRITSLEEALVLHILDSLLLVDAVSGAGGSLMDLGSGAGYPGIPLAIVTERSTVLVESVKKKAKALESMLESLSAIDDRDDSPVAGVSVVAERVEEYAVQDHPPITTVTARAVAPLAALLEYAQPVLEPRGRLVATKGRLEDGELERGLTVAGMLGFELVSRETRDLPQGLGRREILSFEKVGESSVKLPRRPGMARKRPLGE